MINREPVVAGTFYPKTKKELKKELNRLFKQAESKHYDGLVRALIAPHAGFNYSGVVAASAYNQLTNTAYKRVFILATSHRIRFPGASIYSVGDYLTPLGKVQVNLSIASELIQNNSEFNFIKEAHNDEHSIEVQLPFIQNKLGDKIMIVPIVIGTENLEEIGHIADALKPYFNKENLFIVSSDFSHYPTYDDAVKIDNETLQAILTGDTEKFLQVINENKLKGISDLHTSACAWSSILVLLKLTGGNKQFQYKSIQYKNSGDSKHFYDKNSVVGYHAICISEEDHTDFQLKDNDKTELLKIAKNRLIKFVCKKIYSPAEKTSSKALDSNVGAFVSIYVRNELRGCIGQFQGKMKLLKLIEELTVSSLNDHRFEPVLESDLNDVNIEISVLTPLKRIHNLDEFELGKHGIYIKQGMNTGTFLPQVADNTNWSKEEFVSRCSRDKARIGWDGWKSAELFTYEAIIFSDQAIQRELNL